MMVVIMVLKVDLKILIVVDGLAVAEIKAQHLEQVYMLIIAKVEESI
jgi:hypothetical protein